MKRVLVLAAVMTLAVAGNAFAADSAKGEKLFKRCGACHTIKAGGKNKVGPNLFGIVGRKIGVGKGYKYSKSYLDAGGSGMTWTEDAILEYLADPKAYMRKITSNPKARSKMALKLKKEADRQDVVSYLATQK